MEAKVVSSLTIIRNHVIAVGGGTLEKDESCHILKSLGTLIWIDTAPASIAWRLSQNISELKKRPLLSDLSNEGDRMRRFELLKTRLETLHSERSLRYDEAPLVLRDNISASEICAQKVACLATYYLKSKENPEVKFDNEYVYQRFSKGNLL